MEDSPGSAQHSHCVISFLGEDYISVFLPIFLIFIIFVLGTISKIIDFLKKLER